ADDGDLGRLRADTAGVTRTVSKVATADRAGGVGRVPVLVHVQEDVALDPSIGAIDVEAVVIAPGNNVANKMHNRIAALAAGEINDIIVVVRMAKKVAQEKAVPIG